jgi:RNA polymerase-binding transcription factor DksA
MTRKQHLQALLASLEASELPKGGLEIQKGDALDEASRMSEQAVTVELLRHRKESISVIKAALLHDSNSCASCGELIGEKRLEVVPWAINCVGCQEREERNRRDVMEGHQLRMYFQRMRTKDYNARIKGLYETNRPTISYSKEKGNKK